MQNMENQPEFVSKVWIEACFFLTLITAGETPTVRILLKTTTTKRTTPLYK